MSNRHLSTWILGVLFILNLAFPLRASEPVPADQFHTTQTMRFETKRLISYLERQHYLGYKISELDQGQFIDDYLHDFDVNRLYLLQSDVNGFKERYEGSMADFVENGHIEPAFQMFLTFRHRVQDRIVWIHDYLGQDFALDGDFTYAPDRQKASWPSTTAEADDLWGRRLRFDVVNELLAQISDDDDADITQLLLETESIHTDTSETVDNVDVEESTEETSEFDYEKALATAKEEVNKRYERLGKWVAEIEPSEVQEIFLTALTHQYDPHSTYMSADTLEEFAIAMRNSLVGIGALLGDVDGFCTIRELLPGGPAERSRLLDPKDQIVGVAQGEDGEMVDVIGMKLDKIVKLIRGKKGTVVRLLIKPAGADPSERKTISLVRDEIQLTAKLARAEIFEVPHADRTIPIGVIELPAFYGSGESADTHSSTTEDVEELISRLKEADVEGIVLDLRGNGGGLLTEAINLTGLFIPVGPVVQVKDYIGHVQEFLDQDPKVAWSGPLIVLTSRYSASASEIAAGALQNYGRALIVGDGETHGKGTVQAVFEMARSNFLSMVKPRSGAAKVTIQKYYLPDGTSTQLKGVRSDIILPSLNAYLPIGEDSLHNALAWDSINSLDWNYDVSTAQENFLVDDALIAQLNEQSQVRQQSLDEFSYLKENIDWFRERQEQKEFSLNFNLRRQSREDDIQFRDLMEERRDDLASYNFPSRKVLLTVTEQQNAEHDAYLKERAAKQSLAQAPSDAPGLISEKTISEDAEATKPEDTIVVETVEIEEIEEEKPILDIQLREGLRIMADWISLLDKETKGAAAKLSAVTDPGGQS